MKALVIDDEKLVRWFLERALKKWDFEVKTASNGDEATAMLERERYDIVFTDLKMPAADGTLVIEYLSKLSDPPRIIVCSAYITAEMEEEYASRGIYSLKKPFKLDELEKALRKTITLP